MSKWEILTFMMGNGFVIFGSVQLLCRKNAKKRPTFGEMACFAVGIALLCVWASI